MQSAFDPVCILGLVKDIYTFESQKIIITKKLAYFPKYSWSHLKNMRNLPLHRLQRHKLPIGQPDNYELVNNVELYLRKLVANRTNTERDGHSNDPS